MSVHLHGDILAAHWRNPFGMLYLRSPGFCIFVSKNSSMKFSIRPAWFRSNRMYIRSICICILSLTGYGRLAAQHPLSKKNAALLAEQFLQRKKQIQKPHADSVWNGKEIVYGQYRMPFTCTEFGDAPKNGHSLYISLHGGGNVPAEDNDQQWRNQQRLYKVKEGLYVAPRAPTNTWNLWHEAHIGPMLDDLIGALIVSRGVDPDKVYITGYSAGGDGVYQLATRMADRWAAAGMMAGHPGDADIRNLRNLPFALFVGGLDSAYNRNGLGEWWGHQLDSLQHVDTTGFIHLVRVYPDKAHWMDRRDTLGVEWMAQFNRKTLPAKVVWVMDDQFESSCYWLATDTSKLHHRLHCYSGDRGQYY